MALQYLIDGYNLLKQMPGLTGESLRNGRDGLIRFIRTKKPQGKNEVIIIFDGKSDIDNPQKAITDIKIIFTQKVSADEKIKQMVEKSSQPNQIVVVTDDKEIRYCVRALGAKVVSVREFMGKVTEDKQVRPVPKTCLSSQEENEITKELEKIWLRGI